MKDETTATTRRRFSHENQFGRNGGEGLVPFETRCPEWCRVAAGTSDHLFHLDYEPWGNRAQERLHEGPAFGAIRIEATESIDRQGVYSLSPRISSIAAEADLRQLATDALAAAEWLVARS